MLVPDRPDLAPTTDKRTITRRAKERERKRRLREAFEQRMALERLVLDIAATGASIREIALSITAAGHKISKSRVHQIYQAAMARVETETVVDYRSGAMYSLGVLHQQAFKAALEGDMAGVREARHTRDQMNRLMGAYPAIGVDLTGTVIHDHGDLGRVAGALEALQARVVRRRGLALEADAVDALDAKPAIGPAANGRIVDNGSAA